jgi:hypothetical protein
MIKFVLRSAFSVWRSANKLNTFKITQNTERLPGGRQASRRTKINLRFELYALNFL